MEKKVSSIRSAFEQDLRAASSSADVESLRLKYLGKKGLVQELMQELKGASAEQRPLWGQMVNSLKEQVSLFCQEAKEAFSTAEESKALSREGVDVTLPGKRRSLGKLHPIRHMLRDITAILRELGFIIQTGPKIDSEWYNFEGLNYPSDHPARDMQDTFYITDKLLLRSQTSNVQIRTMEKYSPPIRMIAPGGVFRNENVSARSHVFFHQIEGMYIDKKVSLADLFDTMDELWRKLFGPSVKTRFRPSYFPFVEPGVEVDIHCTNCQGKGCRLCKSTGWLEVCGAGMIHPEVLKNGGIHPHEYSGFAFGMGIERLAMLRYRNLSDIRMFSENDIRLLSQIF